MATNKKRCPLTIQWDIENLSFFEHELHGRNIYSPYIHQTLESNVWVLELLPKEEKDEKNPNVRLHLWKGILDYLIDCEISFLTYDVQPLHVCTVWKHDTGLHKTLNFTNCPTQVELFPTMKSVFLPRYTLTVQCRIWKSHGSFSQDEYVFPRSSIVVAEKSFWGPVEASRRVELNPNTMLSFPLDYIQDKEELSLHFSFTRATCMGMIEAWVRLTGKTSNDKLTITLKMYDLDFQQKPIRYAMQKITFHESNSEPISFTISWKELPEKKSLLYNRVTHSLYCQVTAVRNRILGCIDANRNGVSIEKGDDTRNVSNLSRSSCLSSQQTDGGPDGIQPNCDSVAVLLEDLLSLYQGQTFSDFDLVSGGVSFPVHRNILSARSPVFKAMLSSDMKESDSASLEVPDVDAHTLGRMLTFLYTGSVNGLTWEGATRLYYAADKYQVQSLKKECSSVLQSDISVSNVCDLLQLADRHQDKELTSFVHAFILSRFDDVMHSDEWETFLETEPLLAGKTMHQLYKKRSEQSE